MIKELPLILSCSRVVISLILPFVEVFSGIFLALVAIAVLTDFLDGKTARIIGSTERYGPLLDSIADGFLVVSLLICILPNIALEDWMVCWIAALAVARVIAIAVGTYRFKQLAFLHSYLNKVTGAVVYVSPFLIVLIGVQITVVVACIIASVSTIEHFNYNINSTEYDPDTPFGFKRRASPTKRRFQ
ncbi:CDP-alcohol phosphatidyltransferase family protein [methanogenic archaeon mixed culture ISO4-G1]|nr:CDP-alcohol phosphatidyltransferase family protein [methanogenic archaeon mixed culture ISO4-G1]